MEELGKWLIGIIVVALVGWRLVWLFQHSEKRSLRKIAKSLAQKRCPHCGKELGG